MRINKACKGFNYKDGGLNDFQIVSLLGSNHENLSRLELQKILYLKNLVSEIPPLANS